MKCSEAMRHLHAYAMRSGGNPVILFTGISGMLILRFRTGSSEENSRCHERHAFPVKSDAKWGNRAILSKLQPASKTVSFPL